jgi:G3E family GTPase
MTPLTVIGGYLGAGKTTLINHLLHHAGGRRLAVLINDFGAINIDERLIAAHDGETITLTNGCVCCTVSDALGDALDKVLTARPLADQIIVEASGVADPAKVANYGRGWPGLRLDAVLVVADAETVQGRANDKFVGRLVREQLEAADAVVLTKVDLLSDHAEFTVRAWISEVAGNPPILSSVHGQVPVELLLEPRSQSFEPVEPAIECDHGRDRSHGIMFESISFESDHPFDRDALTRIIESLPQAVWRLKGWIRFCDAPETAYFLQRVGRRWELRPAPELGSPDGRSTLVLTGSRGAFDPDSVRSQLASAVADP